MIIFKTECGVWLTFDLSRRRLVVFTAQTTSDSCCVDHGKRLDQFNFNWETQLMSSWDFYSRKNIDQSQKGIVCCLLLNPKEKCIVTMVYFQQQKH